MRYPETPSAPAGDPKPDESPPATEAPTEAPAPAGPSQEAIDAAERTAFQVGMGKGLYVGGALTLPLGIGAAVGYWVADANILWVPDMVGGLLFVWMVALIALTAGSYMMGPLQGKPKGRKRIAVLTMGICAIAGVQVAIKLVEQTSPLTAMEERAFYEVFRNDAQQFLEMDRGLEQVLRSLEGLDAFQPTDGKPSVLTAEEERTVLDAWLTYVHTSIHLDRIRAFYEDYMRFDLSRSQRDRHLRSYLLTFSAELSLYEHTARLTDLLAVNPNAVTFLNVARPEYGLPQDSVAAVREELAGLTDLARVKAGHGYLVSLDKTFHAKRVSEDNGFGWLYTDTERLLTRVRRRRDRDLAALSVSSDFAPIKRKIKHLTFPVQKSVADWMGDVKVRRVGEYLITKEQTDAAEKTLAPGDCMIGRKNWYFSNVGLPGFWPHAMLYVGSNEQISKAFDADPGVLNWVKEQCGRDLVFSDYLALTYPHAWEERARADEQHVLTVIEAVGEGVLQSTLEHSSGDYLAALRPKLEPWVKARAISRAFGYLGRPYDFDFDFATDHALVCSELVWRSYRPLEGANDPGLELATVRVAGRETLPPQEMARHFAQTQGKPEAQFEFVLFIDCNEKQGKAFSSDAKTFAATVTRSKWDFAQK